MDANGLRFWLLADKEDWAPANGQTHVEYDSACRRLRLASEGSLPVPPAADLPALEASALARLEAIPQARDGFGTRAAWDAGRGAVLASGALPGTVPIYLPPTDLLLTDLAIGYDGVLYLAVDGGVTLVDLRDRWNPVSVRAEGFAAWRLSADPAGGVWALDRINRRLARLRGLPFPTRPYGSYAPETFRPREENPAPPRLTVLLETAWPAEERPVAIACSPRGRLALLTWAGAGEARLRCLDPLWQFGAPVTLTGASFPYSLAWVSDDRVALLLAVAGAAAEAPVYTLVEGAAAVQPVGDLYPLRGASGGAFLHGVTLPPHYPTGSGSAPLHHLSLPGFAPRGEAVNRPALDSGSAQTVWHRLYLEAVIPAHCGVKVHLAASDDPLAPVAAADWHEHRFGALFSGEGAAGLPRAAWVDSPSELPYHPGLLDCPRERGRSGLFTVLVQRGTRRVRALQGRYLHVRLELLGDGRSTPEVAALRAYGSRFSYRDHYLPRLYHETLFGDDADEPVLSAAPDGSTPADFLERFLDNFEGVLTPLEDRIAGAYLLTDPRTAPEEALEWLGSWIAVAFDPAYPPARRRRLLEATPALYRRRGTVEGLKLALDVATDGAVTGGEVVVLEDFRLRRVFATILGADLADEDDPLLGGLAVSGNSYVGDTLFLGDERRQEFLALFGAGLPVSSPEEQAIEALFDRLAQRVTVLVHQEVAPQDLGLIRRVVEQETPAHVLARVLAATQPFIVGMAALVGVDSYLGHKPPHRPVAVGRSQVGVRDLIERPPSLDPRLEGGPRRAGRERPLARAGAGLIEEYGASFNLDGGESRAADGQQIVNYRWTLVE